MVASATPRGVHANHGHRTPLHLSLLAHAVSARCIHGGQACPACPKFDVVTSQSLPSDHRGAKLESLKSIRVSGGYFLPRRCGRTDWTPNSARQELHRVRPGLAVAVIKCKDPEVHEGLIDEVVSHCETSGVRYLFVI